MHTVHGEYSVHMECACTLYNAHEVLLIAALHFQLLMHKISFYSFSYQPHSNLTLTWCWSPFESSIMFMIISRTKYFCHFGSMATRYQCQYPVYESARVQYTCIPVCLYTVYLHTCQYFLVFKNRDAVETSCSFSLQRCSMCSSTKAKTSKDSRALYRRALHLYLHLGWGE